MQQDRKAQTSICCGTLHAGPHSRSTMAIKSDKWIRRQAVENKMIEPFSEKQVLRRRSISYGLSSYGLRRSACLRRVQDLYQRQQRLIIDPKAFLIERSFVSVQGARASSCCRRTLSRWRGLWNTSKFRATCSLSASAKALTRAAASSSTSRRSEAWNGKVL